MEVTVQLSITPEEDCQPPTAETIQWALIHSTASEAIQTALCCAVSLRLSPVRLQEMQLVLSHSLEAARLAGIHEHPDGGLLPWYRKGLDIIAQAREGVPDALHVFDLEGDSADASDRFLSQPPDDGDLTASQG